MSEALLALGVIGTVLVHTLVTEGERRMGMSEGGEAGVLGTAAVDGPQFGVTANPVMQAEEAEETDKTDRTRRKDKTLSLAALARLAKSDSIGVRDSALHILLNRAMSDDFFGEIMLLAWDINNEDPVAKERAVCVVQQLSRSETNRPRLIKWGALKMLAHVISDSENSDRTYRNAVVSLYRLILNNVRRKVSIAKTGVLDRLLLFLTDRAAFSNDLRYWSLLVLHQFCLSDLLHPILVYKGLIPILGAMTRSTFGNSNMQKYCLHALVRLISSLSATEGPPKLQELLDMNIVSIVGACLKNEDAELVSWAVFLIQEFVVRQTARQAFSKVRGIAKILVDMIGHPSSSADSFMPRVALRTLKCIAVQNDAFQADLIKVGALKRLVPYVESADNEAQFWAVSLLHDLVATHSSCHEQFFALKGLDALVKIAHTANSDVCLYVSDIFVFLCGVSKNRPILLNSHILSAIMVFCKGAETDLQYGGALLALNIATFSTESAMLIADYDGIEILSDMCVNSTRQDMQVVAAKALSTMARKDPDVHDLIFRHAVFPIVQGIISTKFIASNTTRLHSFLECLQIFIQPDFLQPIHSSASTFFFRHLDFNSQTKPVCIKILDMLHFPFVADNIAVETEFDGALSEVEASHLREDVRNLPRMGKVVETLAKIGRQHALLGTDEDGDGEEVMDLSTRYFFGFKALGVVIPLFQDVAIRRFLEKNGIASLLLCLIRSNRKSIADQSIATLALCLFQGLDRASLGALPGLLNTLVSHVLVDANAATRFYGDMVFDCLADCTVPGALVRGTAVGMEIDLSSVTPYLYWSKDRLEVRNDSWTFESARSRVGVSGTGKYGFEVVLATSGIIQLGWATSDCRFDPEGGEGVGDNSHSYAYDGNRKKKWHSIYTTNNDYGEEWSEGDVITVLLDLNNGLISYLRNGTDLGVAFTEIDTTREWFAAASLAGGQGCAIKFGGPLDGLRHLPDGFASLDSAIRISCPVERLISVDKMVSSGRVIGEEFGNLVPNDFEWIIPSFYYEVQVCVEDADVPFQFGLTDKTDSLILLGPAYYGGTAALAIVNGESSSDSPVLDALHLKVQELLECKLAELGNVKIAATFQNFELRDGDVLGCGYNSAENVVCFTMNGVPFNVMLKAGNFSRHNYLPYVRNAPKLKTNYGNSAFAWYPESRSSGEEDGGETEEDLFS